MTRLLRIATRSSPLALWQAHDVAASLRHRIVERHERGDAPLDVDVQIITVDTLGDRTQALGTPLHQIGGQGVFVKEVQAAVLDGRADIAVHSAKDLPGQLGEGLRIAAVSRRDDPRDGMVGCSVSDLREGGVIATGSVRRRAQIAALRPDVTFVELRGNMATRAARAESGDVDAVIVGCAGLDRLGLGHRIVERIDPALMLPQVAQAAIAVECRDDDSFAYEILRLINDKEVERQVLGERAFLSRLGAGCQLPIGAMTVPNTVLGANEIEGLIAATNGSVVLRHRVTQRDLGETIEDLGTRLANELLSMGGDKLLAELTANLRS